MANSIKSRRPKTEFRKTAPVECEVEIGGERRTLELLVTQGSFNQLARSEDADRFEALIGGVKLIGDPCPVCEGRGKMADKSVCETCGGTGNTEPISQAILRICGMWGLLRMIPELIHAATSHMPDDERPTLEEINNSVTPNSRDYYNEVFTLLLTSETGKADDKANPTIAGKPAKTAKANGVASSTSTGQGESPKPESVSASPSGNSPN